MRIAAPVVALLAVACGRAGPRPPTPGPRPTAPPPPDAAPAPDAPPADAAAAGADTPAPLLRVDEPPGGPGAAAVYPVTLARVFAFADTQLHHPYGKRTFAQSPWADRVLSTEVAIRPAALDDGADLLLGVFLEERARRFRDATPVFLGDAADLSCTQELDRFVATLRADGLERLGVLASNHDGFFAGNFTSRGDADGALAFTDMPEDWTRACAEPGRRDDHRLTKGRAVRRLAALLPAAPAWATDVAIAGDAPADYRQTRLAFVRPLGGGDAGAPPAWGLFLDTTDYRGFDLTRTRGAGTVGHVADEQLAFLDRAMFEARMAGPVAPLWIAFGHHPTDELAARARARLLRFLDQRPEIVGYVAAHTHVSDERRLLLPSGRAIPEIIVGSTTDWPQAARLLELRLDPDTGRAGLASWRLVLDAERLCAGVAPLPADSLGYLGYRLSRDDTPDLAVGFWEKVLVGIGESQLGAQRIAQTAGALVVENDLVRATAALYRAAPGPLPQVAVTALDGILAQRFRAGDRMADLSSWLAGHAPKVATDAYDLWIDPVLLPVVPRLAPALHSFGRYRRLFEGLRATRASDPERRRWFTCHAARAAAAEAPSRGAHVIP